MYTNNLINCITLLLSYCMWSPSQSPTTARRGLRPGKDMLACISRTPWASRDRTCRASLTWSADQPPPSALAPSARASDSWKRSATRCTCSICERSNDSARARPSLAAPSARRASRIRPLRRAAEKASPRPSSPQAAPARPPHFAGLDGALCCEAARSAAVAAGDTARARVAQDRPGRKRVGARHLIPCPVQSCPVRSCPILSYDMLCAALYYALYHIP